MVRIISGCCISELLSNASVQLMFKLDKGEKIVSNSDSEAKLFATLSLLSSGILVIVLIWSKLLDL